MNSYLIAACRSFKENTKRHPKLRKNSLSETTNEKIILYKSIPCFVRVEGGDSYTLLYALPRDFSFKPERDIDVRLDFYSIGVIYKLCMSYFNNDEVQSNGTKPCYHPYTLAIQAKRVKCDAYLHIKGCLFFVI